MSHSTALHFRNRRTAWLGITAAAWCLLLDASCSSDTSPGPGADASTLDSGSGGRGASGAATGGVVASGGSGGVKATGGATGGTTPNGGHPSMKDAAAPPDATPDGAIDASSSPDAAPSPEASPGDSSVGDAKVDAEAAAPPPPADCQSVSLTPTFTSIYDNLLSVRCVPCHTRATQGTGHQPLQYPPNQSFDQGVAVAYADLLGPPDGGHVSGEMAQGYACGTTGLRRVVPGDPDHSLIVEKLQGLPGTAVATCGARMPYNLPPICPAAINVLRTWIKNGALEN